MQQPTPDYGLDVRGLLRAFGYGRPQGAIWFRCVSLAWLAGYKLEAIEDDTSDPYTTTVRRFRLLPRELPFTFEATITL